MQPTAYTNPHYVLPSLSAYFIVLVGDVRLIYTCYIPFRVVATRYCLFLITIQAFGHSYGLSNSLNNDFAHPRPLSLTTHTLVILPCLLCGTCLSLGLSTYGLSPTYRLLPYISHAKVACVLPFHWSCVYTINFKLLPSCKQLVFTPSPRVSDLSHIYPADIFSTHILTLFLSNSHLDAFFVATCRKT